MIIPPVKQSGTVHPVDPTGSAHDPLLQLPKLDFILDRSSTQESLRVGTKGFYTGGSLKKPVPDEMTLAFTLPQKSTVEVIQPPKELPKPSEKVNLIASQEELFNNYLSNKTEWQTMVDEARTRERRRRSITLNDWGVKHENYAVRPGEDVVVRSGTDPSTAPGRGEFSDEDLTANTEAAWTRLRERALAENLTVEEDSVAGFFKIPELNTIVWPPIKHAVPMLPDAPDFVKYNVTAATHPEVVDPTSAKPKFALEYIVAMVNKGQIGFSKPVEKWGNGYAQYETLIQMAKSTHHAMQKSGLAEKKSDDYKRLWQLCKMEKSPEELGIFKRGDNEKKVLAGLRKEQTIMQNLCRESFILAQEKLDTDMQKLQERINTHKQQHITRQLSPRSQQESAKLIEEVKETYLRLDKIATQLNIQIFASKFAKSLFDKDPQKYVALDAKLKNWTHELSSFLEAELIANKNRHHQTQPFYPNWVDPLRAPLESLLSDAFEFSQAPVEFLSIVPDERPSTVRPRSGSIEKIKEE